MRFILLFLFMIFPATPVSAKVDCSKEERRIDVLNCVETEYDRVEDNVRKAYLQAIYRLSEDGNKARMALLKESQKAWEDYRYKACDAQIEEMSGLSEDFKVKTRLCHTELADRRQKDILKHFKTWDYSHEESKTRNSALRKTMMLDVDDEDNDNEKIEAGEADK